MSALPRRARVKALAKINLSLKVLQKRPDGYHELRTIYQTISLGDVIDIEFLPGWGMQIELESNVAIADNLVVRAAQRVMEAMGITGGVRFRLQKRIPMGAGLGGGSSDAAAVLLALPVLAGRVPGPAMLAGLAAELGSDVSFFLLGGTALGVGRGTEVHPLPDAGAAPGLLVAPGIHISTGEAYAALGRDLTWRAAPNNMSSFEALSWSLGHGSVAEAWAAHGENDFEPFVFRRYPELARVRRRLLKAGARRAMLSGSGSSLFGIFTSRDEKEQVRQRLRDPQIESFYLVSRARYRRMWWRSLLGHLREEKWPPRSRYAR